MTTMTTIFYNASLGLIVCYAAVLVAVNIGALRRRRLRLLSRKVYLP